MKTFMEWIKNQALMSWFGNSKVVDKDGNPSVVYHGTSDSFDEFDPQSSSGLGSYARKGMFFTDHPDVASGYARQRQTLEFKKIIASYNKAKEQYEDYVTEIEKISKSHAPKDYTGNIPRMMTPWLNDLHSSKKINDQDLQKYYDLENLLIKAEEEYEKASENRWSKASPNIMPVYLKIENPYVVEGNNLPWDAVIPQNLEEFDQTKYDGIIFKNVVDNGDESEVPTTVYVVFKPNQIKSASGNNGLFDPNDSKIIK